jgi:hypothetical protein
MKNRLSLIAIAAVFAAISISIYIIHYLIFHDPHHIFIFLIGDIAFLPLEVLLVGIVVERIMARREKEEKLQKLNMVVGAYFSEVGRPLSNMLLTAIDNREMVIDKLHITSSWQTVDYKKARLFVENYKPTSFDNINLQKLCDFLVAKRAFMLRLIENPNLLEHEKFTDLLLASFHLMEELETRPDLSNLPYSDRNHIDNDISRAFKYLAIEWLDYMQHLKVSYPFLYSHYLRISPYQPRPSAIVE